MTPASRSRPSYVASLAVARRDSPAPRSARGHSASQEVKTLRLVGGFARAGRISPAEYAAAAPDPVAAFSGPVASHMNGDHGEELNAMARHYSGVASLEKARLLSLDAGGLDVGVELRGQAMKLRLPFPGGPALARKDIKVTDSERGPPWARLLWRRKSRTSCSSRDD